MPEVGAATANISERFVSLDATPLKTKSLMKLDELKREYKVPKGALLALSLPRRK
jgi:hypothetical protein